MVCSNNGVLKNGILKNTTNREELIGQDHRMINSGYHSREFFKDMWTTMESGHV